MTRKKLLIWCGLVLVGALVYGLGFAGGSGSEDGEARTAAEDPTPYVVGFEYGGKQMEVGDKYSDADEWEQGTRIICIGIKIVDMERFLEAVPSAEAVREWAREKGIEEDLVAAEARIMVVIPPDKTKEEVINRILEHYGAELLEQE